MSRFTFPITFTSLVFWVLLLNVHVQVDCWQQWQVFCRALLQHALCGQARQVGAEFILYDVVHWCIVLHWSEFHVDWRDRLDSGTGLECVHSSAAIKVMTRVFFSIKKTNNLTKKTFHNVVSVGCEGAPNRSRTKLHNSSDKSFFRWIANRERNSFRIIWRESTGMSGGNLNSTASTFSSLASLDATVSTMSANWRIKRSLCLFLASWLCCRSWRNLLLLKSWANSCSSSADI